MLIDAFAVPTFADHVSNPIVFRIAGTAATGLCPVSVRRRSSGTGPTFGTVVLYLIIVERRRSEEDSVAPRGGRRFFLFNQIARPDRSPL